MSNFRPKPIQKPLVVCVGFLGSKPRHVQKYADLMSSIEVNVAPLSSTEEILTTPEVIQFIPPIQTFFSPSRIHESAKTLGDMIETKLQTPAPIEQPKLRKLFHWQKEPIQLTPTSITTNISNYQPRKVLFLCLSNNGAFGYANMLNYLKQYKPKTFQQLNSQTAGVIWDSSPSHPTPDVFQRGFTSAVSSIIGFTPTAYSPILTPLFSGVISLLLKTKAYNQAAEQVTNVLDYNVPYHTPQLYLITEKDDLVLPDATRNYIQQRSKRVKDFFNKYSSHQHVQNALSKSSLNYLHQQHHEHNHEQHEQYEHHGLKLSEHSTSPNNTQQQQQQQQQQKQQQQQEHNDTKTNIQIPVKVDNLSFHNPHHPHLDIFHWTHIADELKHPHEWQQSTIDHHQLQFSLAYNYHQHIFPHYTFNETNQPILSSTTNNNTNTNNDNNIDNNINIINNQHSQFPFATETSALFPSSSTQAKLQLPQLDYRKLPPFHGLKTDALHLDITQPISFQHFKHDDEHNNNEPSCTTNDSTPTTNTTTTKTTTTTTNNNEQHQHQHQHEHGIPLTNDHPSYCPHKDHLDVLFKPHMKATLSTLTLDPKIKPLFERTERFEDGCFHHFLYDFKDSAHVQHIRRHPEDYKQLVSAFVNYAFRG